MALRIDSICQGLQSHRRSRPCGRNNYLAAGCTVGPDYRSPPPPTVSSLTPELLPRSPIPGPDQQAYVKELDIPQQWWSLFRCKPLNKITARAIESNADLDAARAAVRIANANTEAARGSFFPQIGSNFGSSSQKPAAAQVQNVGGGISPYSRSTGQLTVSYMPDVFGLTRRQVESLAAQEEAQHFELEATYLTLTSKLSLAAVQEASLREQVKSAEASIDIARDVLLLLAVTDYARFLEFTVHKAAGLIASGATPREVAKLLLPDQTGFA